MLDFKKIVTETTNYNFHSHSPFCDGKAPIEDFVKEAIRQGFTHYGVTPHSPFPFPSTCNMAFDDAPTYIAEMNRLKSLYGDKINLYTSFEIDFAGGFGPADAYFNTLPLDYKIGSIHFLPAFDNPDIQVDVDGDFKHFAQMMNEHFDNDIDRVVRLFYAQSIKMVETGGFDIIGHFDKIGHNADSFRAGIESEPWYEAEVKRLFDAIMDCHLMIEINTKKWATDHRLFPNVRFFQMLKRAQAPVLFNSDAHVPRLIDAGRREAMKIYENCV